MKGVNSPGKSFVYTWIIAAPATLSALYTVLWSDLCSLPITKRVLLAIVSLTLYPRLGKVIQSSCCPSGEITQYV